MFSNQALKFQPGSIAILKKYGHVILSGSLTLDQQRQFLNEKLAHLKEVINFLSFFITREQLNHLVHRMKNGRDLFNDNEKNTVQKNSDDIFRKKKLATIINLLSGLNHSLTGDDFKYITNHYLIDLIVALNFKVFDEKIKEVNTLVNKLVQNAIYQAKKISFPDNSRTPVFFVNKHYENGYQEKKIHFNEYSEWNEKREFKLNECGKWEIRLSKNDPKLDEIWHGLLKLLKDNNIYAITSVLNIESNDRVINIYNSNIRNIGSIKHIYEELEGLLKKLNVPTGCIKGYETEYATRLKRNEYTTYEQLKSYDKNKKILEQVLNIIEGYKKKHSLSSTARAIAKHLDILIKENPIITSELLSQTIDFIRAQLNEKLSITKKPGTLNFIANLGKRSEATVGLYNRILNAVTNREHFDVPLERSVKAIWTLTPLHKQLHHNKIRSQKYDLLSTLRYGSLVKSRLFSTPDINKENKIKKNKDKLEMEKLIKNFKSSIKNFKS